MTLRARYRRRWTQAVAVLAVLLGTAPLPAAERFVGDAYAPTGGELLYREVHWRWQERAGVSRHLVLYECAAGGAFARKELAGEPTAGDPDFDFEDARDGYREGVRRVHAVRQVYWQQASDAPRQSRPLPLAANALIDAGFDDFVRAHWGQLSHTPMTVAFLVPSRLGYLELAVEPVTSPGPHAAVARLRLRLAAWYGFAAPQILLTYDRDGRHLLQYEGPGTIRDARGRPQPVRIVFPAEQYREVPAAETEAARRQALVARCPG